MLPRRRLLRSTVDIASLHNSHSCAPAVNSAFGEVSSNSFAMRLASDAFFGLSAAKQDGGPAVAVNAWDRVSVEGWIFTAQVGLGSLLGEAHA